MPIRVRDALLIPGTGAPSDPVRSHLFFVLKERDGSGKFMAAPVGTCKSNSDRTCLLNPGDHSFIQHQSVVLYARVHLFDDGRVWSAIRRGDVATFEPASDDLFQRTINGLRRSPFAGGWARKKYGNP